MHTTSLRRSKRIKENLESQQTVTKTDAKPTKKRAKVESRISDSEPKNVAGTRGPLQPMTEIPLDALHEILRYLDPMDLLNLSWTNRDLNHVVMEKSARYIWKESFERLYMLGIPPPPCPERLTLAQYARFLFHNTCMVCEKHGNRWVSWTMRLRVCSKCLPGPRFTYAAYPLLYEYPTISNKRNAYCLAVDIENGPARGYQEKRRLLQNLEVGEPVFLVWERGRLEEIKDRIRLERQNAILAKLEKLGWRETEITEMYGGGFPADLAGFWASRKLTDGDWRNIKPKILQQLKARKNNIIQERRAMRWKCFQTRFGEWFKTQTMESFFLPHLVDVAVMEPFSSIMFESEAETVEFELDEIDRAAKEWIESRNEVILSLLPEDIRERYGADGFLSRASLVELYFRRREGFSTLREVLDHREYWTKQSTVEPAYQKIYRMLPDRKLPWNWSNEDLTFYCVHIATWSEQRFKPTFYDLEAISAMG